MSLRKKVDNKLSYFTTKLSVYNNIYISKGALLHNFDLFSKLPRTEYVVPVLKSNAYGHGLSQVTEILKARKFPYIAVDGYFEAIRIHEISKQPVLVMGSMAPENYKKIDFKNCAFVVHDEVILNALSATKKHVKIHLELETGMGRHGVRLDNLDKFLELINKDEKLELEGVMTHLADADNPSSQAHVLMQQERFDTAVEKIHEIGLKPKYVHIAQSAGSVKIKSKYANTLRIGIALYGISPLDLRDIFAKELNSIKPVLTLKSTVAKILEIDAGDTVSYGCTFVASRKSRIGVLPLGYYEGVPRALSNAGVVNYKDQYLPIVGRVCMNHTMIDLTDSEVEFGDEVIVYSADKADKNSIDKLCQRHNLFNYSFLTGLNQNIRRTIVD